MIWLAVAMASAGCYLTKLAGLSVPGRVIERPVVRRVAALHKQFGHAHLGGVHVSLHLNESDGRLRQLAIREL